MPMTIYKLYGADAGDSVASLDVQLDGDIMAIHMSMMCTGAALVNDGGQAELSFLSTNTFTNSDVRGSLMIIQSRLGFLTTGGGNTAINANVSSLEIPVNAGERVHLHIQHLGGVTAATTNAYIFVKDKGTGRIAGRRR